MLTTKHTKRTRIGATLTALALALTLPVMAMAQTVAATADATGGATVQAGPSTGNQPSMGNQPNRGNQSGAQNQPGSGSQPDMGIQPDTLDLSTLTEAQRTTYDNAIALYWQIEDAVLADLVASGTVAQADVDAYRALREGRQALAELDQSGWTAAQYKAYYEAMQQTGDARTAAMQALADAGQLTQAQANALAAQGEGNLWRTLEQNRATNSNIQTALRTLQQARQALNQTLRSAGISGLAAKDQLGSLAAGNQRPEGGAGGGGNGQRPTPTYGDDDNEEAENDD